MYTTESSLLGAGRIGQTPWSEVLEERAKTLQQANDAAFIVSQYHTFAFELGLNPDLALAQFCEETGYGTSDRWVRQRNPCGLGITSDDVPGHDFGTIPVGIEAHLDHLCCYAYPASTCPIAHHLTPDFRHTFHDGNPMLSHLQDDTRKWATKSGYVERILAIVNRLAPVVPPDEPKGPNMALAIREAIIPATNANRPKLPMTPKYITVHETANTNAGANAEMHRRFLVNGGGPEGVSFHWCVDDKEAVHLIPDSENAWHAGDGANGTGNRQSIAIETCVNRDGDWPATLRNLAALVAILMQRHGIPLANVVQHNRWSGKDCPHQLRAAGWAGQVAAIKAAYEALTKPAPAPFVHAPGFLGPPLIVNHNYGGDTAGIITKIVTEVYNDEQRKFYRLTWTPEEGDKVEAI